MLLLVSVAGWLATAFAQGSRPTLGATLSIKSSSTTVLPVDQAFRFSAVVAGKQGVQLLWNMQPGYYLYQQKLEVQDGTGRALSLALPPATTLTDEFLGESKVYFDSLLITLPLRDVTQSLQGGVVLKVIYQGCAQDRYCYPPVNRQITLNLPK